MPVKNIKNSINNHRYLYLLIFAGIVFLSYFFFAPGQVKLYFNDTFIGKWLTPSRNALKKSFNLVHLPYWFKKSNLPTYYITTSKDDVEKLLAGLPFDSSTLSYGYLLDEDKQYVKADFASPGDDYAARVSIRYRGIASNNWNAEKKALKIKFPKDNLFSGARGLNFFLPDDRSYFGEMLDAYRAKKFGLLTPEFKFVRVVMNGRDFGIYLAAEPWSKEFLARNGVMDTNNILSNQDVSSVAQNTFSYFTSEHLAEWKSYTAENENGTFEELNALISLVENADDEEFARKIGSIFDLEKLYRWQLLYALASSGHAGDSANSVLLFKQETGKFEYLPWDVEMYPARPHFYDGVSILMKRILSNQKFLAEYQKVVADYTSNDKNLEDDLNYYDDLYRDYFHEFYKDQAKLYPDYYFDKKVKEYRSFVIDNFVNAKELNSGLAVSDFSSGRARGSKVPVFAGSFTHFNDIFASIDQFAAAFPQFKKLDSGTIILPAGDHIFTGITVIPKGLKFVIEPGAKLLFASAASLISYSPVNAIGAESATIMMQGLSIGQAPWGSFAVINTGTEKNLFSYIQVSGGGEGGVINGVPFISQFSLHNTISEVNNSTFGYNYSDDSLHAIVGSVSIKGSRFINSNADGLDFDYVKDAVIAGNFFFNANYGDSSGDGLDLSGARGLEIKNNRIVNFGDKCISVGEDSQADINGNILINCNIGIAVKDNSQPRINSNIILASRETGVALYRKKQEFVKGGQTEVADSILWGNKTDITKDVFSFIKIRDSVVENGYPDGEKITTARPDFIRLLPAYMLQYLNMNAK
ncbi:hypothetical protein A2833_01955 [Candidatus Azambacteria bacterium RIFCSPHIGHO2_01_FULL_44_55]|uniref:Right handed beta helix domain-containing protein n=1 Tax=Candidatus Azambacteria bacterium RIFCSPLOWO2_02_FULL_44_14 TaxID=1797306 RepID=A0A1F5CD51_9BACT|nr:MAG: hypothetical protein A2833_01955 [Candidatus Azambacteria bacterium RIFCSPHIGHO2_01_FULL_44_55]OGD40775.1 MAG: hypothetical protein A3I30_01740 [Candidatus Azambacteria bacterium RIFCSPLOWO2_02_FULL_44_14]